MNEKLERVLTNIFGIFISISVLGGIIVFVTYIFGMIAGGEIGGSWMVAAWEKLVPYFIKSAALGVLAGLLLFYVTGNHTLSLREEKNKRNISLNEEEKEGTL